jgi:hypothetical protein
MNRARYIAAAIAVAGFVMMTVAAHFRAEPWVGIGLFSFFGGCLAGTLVGIVECTPWYWRRRQARWEAHMARIRRRARLEAFYRLRPLRSCK